MYDVIVNTDASLHYTKKIGCIAWVIKSADGEVIDRRAQILYAEESRGLETIYLELFAIKSAIKRLVKLELKDKRILIKSDCKYAVQYIIKSRVSFPNEPKSSSKSFSLAYSICSRVILQNLNVMFRWVPRKHNKEADLEAREGLRKVNVKNGRIKTGFSI